MTTVANGRPRVRFTDAQIEMAHGAGGKASRRLVEGLIAPAFANPVLATLGDAAVFPLGGARVATTADGYVVRPLRFPGGSIGELAVNGTVNDLAVSGARATALMASFILEAGLPATCCGPRSRRWRRPRRGPACRSSAATPRWSSTASATACTSPRSASAWSTRG